MNSAVEERFWSKVDKSGDCWLWTASVDRKGYGMFGINRGNGRAHRIAWELANGPIPAGKQICHACDNPPCVNPDHLWLGTNRENMEDARLKGKWVGSPTKARGEANGGGGKLKESDIPEIRALRAKGWTQQAIANQFGVNQTMISFILRGVAWAHV